MARKLIVTLLAVVFLAAQAATVLAEHPDKGPGCGLGKLAWADYTNQKNIAPQVMMATTNGTFGSQTFGISSGTSGCSNDGMIMGQHKVNVFASINFENLSQDMAQGGGEHLTSLATLMSIPEDQHAEFFAMTQERYLSLVETGESSPVALVKALNDATATHPVLANVTTAR